MNTWRIVDHSRTVAAAALVLAVVGVAAGASWLGGRPPEQTTALPTSTTAAPPAPSTTAAIPAHPPRTVRSGALAAALEPVWREAPGGCISVTAGDQVLYEANPDGSVVPASVTKLFTAAAALEGLGASSRFRTSVRVGAPAISGVVPGDLWLVGGGDPVLGTDAWAAQLEAEDAASHVARQLGGSGGGVGDPQDRRAGGR